MAEPRTPAERRDELAADRDDAADQRDTTADGRDGAADRRDTDAVDRDIQDRINLDRFAERFRGLARQIIDRVGRTATDTVDLQDWPDLTPAALAHLAEQRRLAALDVQAVSALLDQLQVELSHLRNSRHAAARDRRSSADDRHASSRDRRNAFQDRTHSAGDRSQSVIEREQVDPRDLPSDDPDIHGTTPSRADTAVAPPLSDSGDRVNRNRRP